MYMFVGPSEEGGRSLPSWSYRWSWAADRDAGIELQSSAGAVSVLNPWALSRWYVGVSICLVCPLKLRTILCFSPTPFLVFGLFCFGQAFPLYISYPWTPSVANLASNLQRFCLSFLSADTTGMQYPTLLENLDPDVLSHGPWSFILLCLASGCQYHVIFIYLTILSS